MEDSADWAREATATSHPFTSLDREKKGGSQLKKREDTISQRAREQRGQEYTVSHFITDKKKRREHPWII